MTGQIALFFIFISDRLIFLNIFCNIDILCSYSGSSFYLFILYESVYMLYHSVNTLHLIGYPGGHLSGPRPWCHCCCPYPSTPCGFTSLRQATVCWSQEQESWSQGNWFSTLCHGPASKIIIRKWIITKMNSNYATESTKTKVKVCVRTNLI